jgi:hypothetical protein
MCDPIEKFFAPYSPDLQAIGFPYPLLRETPPNWGLTSVNGS